MNRLRRTSQVDATLLGCWTGSGYVRSVYAPVGMFAGVALKCEATTVWAKQGGLMVAFK
jgi:hypothetical protein